MDNYQGCSTTLRILIQLVTRILAPSYICSGHLTGGYLASLLTVASPKFAPFGRKLQIAPPVICNCRPAFDSL